MNKQEAVWFRDSQRQLDRQAGEFLRQAREDQPFYGNGVRYQNLWGNPARWWQISYDTSRRSNRLGRGIVLSFYAAMVLIGAVLSLVH